MNCQGSTRTRLPAVVRFSARTTPRRCPRPTTSSSTWPPWVIYTRARHLAEDTLARRRRILGDDHPDTLSSANNLARVLRALGEVGQACRLADDTLTRRREVLGTDHPSTLSSANNLVVDLAALGDHTPSPPPGRRHTRPPPPYPRRRPPGHPVLGQQPGARPPTSGRVRGGPPPRRGHVEPPSERARRGPSRHRVVRQQPGDRSARELGDGEHARDRNG